MTDESFKGSDCKYRTFLKDYKIVNKGTNDEQVFIDNDSKDRYQKELFAMAASKKSKR